MQYKALLIGAVTGATLVCFALIAGGERQPETGFKQRWLHIDVPQDTGLMLFADTVTKECRQNKSLLAFEHAFDSSRIHRLQTNISALHSAANDSWWAQVIDLFDGPAVAVDPATFNLSDRNSAVAIKRWTKRIELSYQERQQSSSSIKLVYDIKVSADGNDVEVVPQALNSSYALTIDDRFFNEKRYLTSSNELSAGNAPNCAVRALPAKYPELNWSTHTIQNPESNTAKCILRGHYRNNPVIHFNISCGAVAS